MHRGTQSAAGGTIQRLKPIPAMVRSRLSRPGARPDNVVELMNRLLPELFHFGQARSLNHARVTSLGQLSVIVQLPAGPADQAAPSPCRIAPGWYRAFWGPRISADDRQSRQLPDRASDARSTCRSGWPY